jgi:hypothetical protein
MSNPFFTIGHSTRSVAEFVELLQLSEIATVVDAAVPHQPAVQP